MKPNNEKKVVDVSALSEEWNRKYNRLELSVFMKRNIYIRSHNVYTPYSFEGHAPILDVAQNLSKHPYIVAMKCAQIGWSTFMIARTLWLVDGQNLNAAFFFPNQQAMIDFVQYRINEILENSPYLQKQMELGGTDNVKIKKIGKSIIAFRATSTMTGVKSFDSDINVEDEVDEHDPETLQFTKDRLLHSKYGWIMSGSQPSIDFFGIHDVFMKSDQRYWLVKCGCGYWVNMVESFLEDPESIFSKDKTVYACKKCGKKLNPQKGQYVPKAESDIAGVQISQLFFDYQKPYDIWKKFKSTDSLIKRKNFYISVIGVPYSTDEEKPLTKEIIRQFCGSEGLKTGSTYFTYHGADQGDTVHCVFAEPTDDGKIEIVGLAKHSVLDEALYKANIERFNVTYGVIDAMPNRNWSLRMALEFPDVLKIQFFTKKYSEKEEKVLGEEAVEVITVNRDESLQDLIDCIKRGVFIFPNPDRLDGADLALYEEFEYHLTMLIKERKEDEYGKTVYQFKKKVPNHFGMALNSLRLSATGGFRQDYEMRFMNGNFY